MQGFDGRRLWDLPVILSESFHAESWTILVCSPCATKVENATTVLINRAPHSRIVYPCQSYAAFRDLRWRPESNTIATGREVGSDTIKDKLVFNVDPPELRNIGDKLGILIVIFIW